MDCSELATHCPNWHPAFETILKSVEVSGDHVQLKDVSAALKDRIKPNRPLVVLCPHADDGAITAACLIYEYATKRKVPVVEVLVFAGERNVDFPWLTEKKRAEVREREFRHECEVLGAQAVCWDLDAYRSPGYSPSASDLEKTIAWFVENKPGAVILPPATDGHLAHRMTRALASIGLIGANLTDTLVMSGWTPWGPLPRPNAYFQYEIEHERVKQWAINCHASQLILTDYFEFCSHLGRAYATLAPEWSHGHTPAASRSRITEPRFIGVELFQVENYDPERAYLNLMDPIQIALGVLGGKVDPAQISLFQTSPAAAAP